MGQYRQGTVSVTEGSQTVLGEGTAWLTNVQPGNLFSVSNDNVWYTIAAVGGNGEMTLETPYSGETEEDLSYAVHRDFTPNLLMPYPTYGDTNTGSLLGVAMTTLDGAINTLSAGSVFGGTISSQFLVQKGSTGAPTKAAGLVVKRGSLIDASILFRDDQANRRWEFNGFNVGQIGDLHTAGNVGLGEEPGSERLRVAGNTRVAGDLVVTGSITGSLSLAPSGVTPGTWSKLTVNAAGIVTAGSNPTPADIAGALGYTPFSSLGGTVSGNLIVTGDLTVQGDTVTLNTSTIEVEDPIITVGRANTGAVSYLGLKAERGASDAYLVFNESNDRWQALLSSNDLSTAGTLGAIEAATFYGALSGNAATATKLATARTINGASFDGSANISFNTDAVAEGGSNLYFTTARARAALSGSNGVSVNNTTGIITFDAASASIAISNVSGLQTALDGKAAFSHNHTVSQITDIASNYQALSAKNVANGYPGLNGNGRVITQLEGFVYNFASLTTATDLNDITAAGEYNFDVSGKTNAPPAFTSGWIYLTVQQHTYSVGGNFVRQYATALGYIDWNVWARQRAGGAWSSWVRVGGPITGYGAVVSLNNSAKIDNTLLSLSKGDVGLSNVDNTSDANKPISNAMQAALNGKASLGKLDGIVTYSAGTSRTLAITDLGKMVEMNNAAANTLFIPPDSAVSFPLYTYIPVVQIGAGQTTIGAGAGVTVRSQGGRYRLTGQFAQAGLFKRDWDEWVIAGDLVV